MTTEDKNKASDDIITKLALLHGIDLDFCHAERKALICQSVRRRLLSYFDGAVKGSLEDLIHYNKGAVERINPSNFHHMDRNKAFLDVNLNHCEPKLSVRTAGGFFCDYSEWIVKCRDLGFNANKG